MKKSFAFIISFFIGMLSLTGCGDAAVIGVIGFGDPDTNNSGMQGEALAAYSSFMSGDSALLDEQQSEMWWIPDFQSESMDYEYAYLDLDGDGTVELIIQMEDAPHDYNGVFHFEDGRIYCWNSDAMEMSCRDYPLSDATMVRQYDMNGSSYTVFSYNSDGEAETVHSLFAREERITDDSTEPCPYYEVDGEEVDEAEFYEQLDALVLDKLLNRSEWTAI